MNLPFSSTKLIPPSRLLDSAISREVFDIRLVESSRIVTMEAPAGFGKTTRVLQLLRECPGETAWITIAPPMDSPVVFWSTVLQVLLPPLSQDREALEVRFQTVGENSESAVVALCNALAENPQPMDLVLDDFHNIGKDIEDSLILFFDSIPDSIRTWIVSRRSIGLPLAPFVLRGQLLEIGREQLSFSRTETESILRDASPEISEDAVSIIHERTRGWPAAVQLLSRLHRRSPNYKDLMSDISISGQTFGPHLVNELLNTLTDFERDFVLRTTILPSMTPEEAAELVNDLDSSSCDAVLTDLERRGFFVASHPSLPGTYEFLPFFRDLLIAYRVEHREEYRISVEHAVSLLERQGAVEQAWHVARESGCIDLAADILTRHAESWFSTGRYAKFGELVGEIPSNVVRNHDPLGAQLVWARTVSNQDCTADDLQSRPEESVSSGGLRAAARGYDAFYNGGRFEHIITALSEAEHLSVQGYQSVSMIAQFLQINTHHWHGECETAYRILTETDREQLYAVYPYLGVLHDVNLGNLLVDLRRAPEASALYDDARAHLIAAYGREDFPFWGIVEMQAALVESRDNPTDQLQRRTAHALLLTEEHGIDEIVFLAHMYAAQIVAAKDIQLAYDHIDRSLAHTGTSRWGRRLVLSHAVRCAALFDSPEEVRRWYFQMTAVDTTGDLGTVAPRLAECWMWWRLDERTSALRGIETLLSDEYTTPLHRLEAELLRLRITTDPTSNEQARITSQCTQEGLGTWANQLLEGSKTGHRESHADPTQSPVLGIQDLPSDEAIREMRDLHCDIEIDGYNESFQGREIQILFLMARGASNTEIADIIYISVNTVRWYARQIYAKLNVRRRGEAVQAAWRLGLIGRQNEPTEPRHA